MPSDHEATNGQLPRALELIHPASLARLAEQLSGLMRSRLWLQVLVGMLAGVGVGLLLGPTAGWMSASTAAVIAEWVALPGYFFLALIQMVVVPLVFASVVRGIASNESSDQLRKTGLTLVGYLLVTTALSVAIGVGLATWLEPGSFVEFTAAPAVALPAAEPMQLSLEALPKSVVSVIPGNPLTAMSESQMLQIVIVALIFGLALVNLPGRSALPLIDLLGSLEAVCMAIVRWVMVVAPFAVFGLIAKLTLTTGFEVLFGMGVYVGVTLLGFAVLLAMYMVIVALLGRRRPLRFLRDIRDAQLMAFSTNSSAATMPVSLRVAEENLKVRPSTARFIIPIGATVNMDASALYQGMATVFIAQVYGIELSVTSLVIIVITAVGASIGTPATPGVGIVVLSSVLSSVGVPLEGLTLIVGLDRILELFRSSLNVTGDLVACTVMDRLVEVDLSRDDEIALDRARMAQTAGPQTAAPA